MTRLIGLAGSAGAGKDHAYGVLKTLLAPWTVERVAFADGLKFDIEEALDVSPYSLPMLRDKPYTPEIRALLQWWGTELRRDQDEDYWVNKGMEMVAEANGYADLVVITDVRFANEADLIRKNGGLVVEVYAPQKIRMVRLGGIAPPSHASEVIDFEVDAMIDNSGTTIIPPMVNEYIGREPHHSVHPA
jgi:hypothetical protein